MTIWFIAAAVALAVWWVERQGSIKATQAIVKRIFLSLRLGLEAVLFVVLLNTVILLVGMITTGTRGHIAVCLLGIGTSVAIVVIIVFDALRVRIKLNELDAALFPPAPDL